MKLVHPIRRNIGRAGLIKIFLESDYTNVSWPRLRDAIDIRIEHEEISLRLEFLSGLPN